MQLRACSARIHMWHPAHMLAITHASDHMLAIRAERTRLVAASGCACRTHFLTSPTPHLPRRPHIVHVQKYADRHAVHNDFHDPAVFA